jgi:hypothetical protein
MAVFALLALLAMRPLVGVWRNEPGAWQAKPLWWRRSIPTVVSVGWAMLLGAVATPLAMSHDGIIGGVFTAVVVVALLVFVLGFVLWPPVALLGQPRFLVPPHLRGQSSDVTSNSEADAYFAQRGFSLRVEPRDLDDELPRDAPSRGSTHWADLVSSRTGRVVARSYGSGLSAAEAKESARMRYIVEQDPPGSSS